MDAFRVYSDISGTIKPHSMQVFVISSLWLTNVEHKRMTYKFRVLRSRIARKYRLDLLNMKFTASDLLRGRNQFKTLYIEDRLEIIHRIVDLVIELDIPMMTVIYEPRNLVTNQNRYDYVSWVKHWMWKLYLERITQHANHRAATATIFLQDCNPAINQSLQELISSIRSPYIVEQYLPTIQFELKDELSLLQIVDIIAWIIHRYYMDALIPNDFDTLATELFERINHLFVGDDQDQVEGFGVKIFPTVGEDQAYRPKVVLPHQFRAMVTTLNQIEKQLDKLER